MPLEFQLTSLNLSRRLKSLGVKQESAFCWRVKKGTAEDGIWAIYGTGKSIEEWVGEFRVAAYTTSELGELMLEQDMPYYDGGEWKSAGYYDLPEGRERLVADNEAETRGLQLEHGLLAVTK